MTDTDRALLELESERWQFGGAKVQAIRDRLDMSPTRYHQRLGALLDDPDAYREFPSLLKRLRRLRVQRAGERVSA